ncbi:hypothetical protein [Leptothermofonsia sp. ETS-13]|uniref:hypothetical protein n=1 Tax=Leptothermofonsia sp. ETS-13 TaxID=3035696 RepID=UPI003BA01015
MTKFEPSLIVRSPLSRLLGVLLLATCGMVLPSGNHANSALATFFKGVEVAQAVPARAESWDEVWTLLRQRKIRGGSRGGEVCPLAPAGGYEVSQVWSDRPLFLWQGSLARIEVTDKNGKPLWKQPISKETASIIYGGKSFQPGQNYLWKLFTSRFQSTPKYILPFQMMESQSRDRITADLRALETQLKTKGATTEEIALQRVNYFVNQNLLSDALREMYSVKDPSNALKEIIQQAPSELCR